MTKKKTTMIVWVVSGFAKWIHSNTAPIFTGLNLKQSCMNPRGMLCCEIVTADKMATENHQEAKRLLARADKIVNPPAQQRVISITQL